MSKVILTGFNTPPTSVVTANLVAVIAGTLKVLVWATAITVAVFVAIIGGMMAGRNRHNRRYF